MSHAQRPDGFLRRRLVRVLPVYFACLALTLLVMAVVEHKALPGIGTIIANALMLNQIVTHDSILGPAWSLALECWFYAMLPLLARQSASRVRLFSWLSFAAFVAFTVGRTLIQLPYYAGVGFGANALLLALRLVHRHTPRAQRRRPRGGAARPALDVRRPHRAGYAHRAGAIA